MNEKPLAMDLGTGSGVKLVDLLSRGFHPIGVDDFSDLNGRIIIEEQVQSYIERGEIKYVRKKAQEYVAEQPDNTFSLVSIQRPSGIMALLSVPRYSDRFLKDISRILKPNGIFELTIFERDESDYSVMQIIESKNIFALQERGRNGGLYVAEYMPLNQ